MESRDLLRSVWGTFMAQKARTALTLSGLIIGVGTIVALSSLVGGGLAAIKGSVQDAAGDDLVTASVRYRDERGRRVPPMTPHDVGAVAQAPRFAKGMVLPQLEFRGSAKANGQEVERVWVLGVTDQAARIYRFEMGQGRGLLPLDRQGAARVAIVGAKLAKTLKLGGAGQDLGRINVRGTPFRVVGILKDKPYLNMGNRSWNEAIALPDTTFVAWRGAQQVDEILAYTGDEKARLQVTLPLARETMAAVLALRHHPRSMVELNDLTTRSKGERGFLMALQVLVVAVSLVCMLTGGINIMNIMLVTVSERTREIGLRLAVGASPAVIQSQFLAESAALATLGGLLGAFGGVLVAWLGAWVLTMTLGNWPFLISWAALVSALVAAIGTGILFGWYPARVAARLDPVTALRHE